MARRTLAAVLLLLLALAAQPSWAGSASKSSEKVLGYLQAYPGDCPPAEAPVDPLVCHEVVLSAWRIGTDGPGTNSPPKTHWVVSVVRHTLTFPGGGLDPAESDVVDGFSEDPAVSFDRQHLSTAHLVDQVHLSDGSDLEVQATWTATSERLQYGNDGPALAEAGRLHHVHTRCLTEVNQAHQKYRLAHLHALLNGVPTDDLSIFAFLAYNHFTSVRTVPASCR